MAGGGRWVAMLWPEEAGRQPRHDRKRKSAFIVKIWDAIQIPFDLLEEEGDVIDNTQAPICTDNIEIAVETPLDVEHTEHEEDRKASTISKRKKESPPFVEVICDRTKKTWRFAAGTEAKFAVKMINSKLDSRYQLSPGSHIEAVKDGEESVIFGPNAVLVNYGDAWSLRIATDPAGLGKAKQDNTVVMGQAYHPPTMEEMKIEVFSSEDEGRRVRVVNPQSEYAAIEAVVALVMVETCQGGD
nr:uncharacterized protein LOC109154676 isoform X1 [Ipomoea batatas]